MPKIPELKISNQSDIDDAKNAWQLTASEWQMISRSIEEWWIIVFTWDELESFKSIHETEAKIAFLKTEVAETLVTSWEPLLKAWLNESLGWNLDFFTQTIEASFKSTLFDWSNALLPYLWQNLHPVAKQNLLTGFSFYVSESVHTSAWEEVKDALKKVHELTVWKKPWQTTRQPTEEELDSEKNQKSIWELFKALQSAVKWLDIQKFAQMNHHFSQKWLDEWWTNQPYFMNPHAAKTMFAQLGEWKNIEEITVTLENRTLEMLSWEEESLVTIWSKWNEMLGKGGLLKNIKNALWNIWETLRWPLERWSESLLGWTMIWMLGKYLNTGEASIFKSILTAILKMMWIGDLFGIIDESNIKSVRENVGKLFKGNPKPNIDMLFRKEKSNAEEVDETVVAAFKWLKGKKDKTFSQTVVRVLENEDFKEIWSSLTRDCYVWGIKPGYWFWVNNAVILYKEFLAWPGSEDTWEKGKVDSYIRFKNWESEVAREQERAQAERVLSGPEDVPITASQKVSRQTILANTATAAVAKKRLSNKDVQGKWPRNIPQLTQYHDWKFELPSKYAALRVDYRNVPKTTKYNEKTKLSWEDAKTTLDFPDTGVIRKEIPWLDKMVVWHVATIDQLIKLTLKKDPQTNELINAPSFDKNWNQIIFSCEEKSKFSSMKTKQADWWSGRLWVAFHGSAWWDEALIRTGLVKDKWVPFGFSILSNGNIIMNQPLHEWTWVLGNGTKLWLAWLQWYLNNQFIWVELALRDTKKPKALATWWVKAKTIDIVEDPTHNQLVASQNVMRFITHLTGRKMMVLDSIDPVLWRNWNWVSWMHGDFFRDDFIEAIGWMKRSERQEWLYKTYGIKWDEELDKIILWKYDELGWNVVANA